MNPHPPLTLAAMAAALTMAACATESSHPLPTARLQSPAHPYSGPRTAIAVGKFDNRSSYMRGVFSDGADRLGGQARRILVTQLQQSGRFDVLDRDNLPEIQREAGMQHRQPALKGANFVVTGGVTEFGRKEVGDRQLFGMLGRGRSQVAYAKVALSVVDIHTSAMVYSAEGAGEYELTSREVLGFGGTQGYDTTLNGKVLDLAMREAVMKLIGAMDTGAWKPMLQ